MRSTDYCEKFQVKIVEGAGHFPHQEDPETVNRYILKFLKIRRAIDGADGAINETTTEHSPTKGIMNMMFGAVSNTMKYGNQMIDSVQKRTHSGGFLSFPTSTATVE